MPDPQQQVNALIAGEIDLIEQPPHDLIPLLKKDKGVQLVDWNPLGHQFIIRFNHLVKPFDNPKIRLAALYSMRQEDYLKATVGEPAYYKVCSAAFICGTPNAVDAPNGLLIKPDFEKSKALLKEAGYDGTPIVLMQSTTLPVLTNTAPVTKALLEQGGFKVDMQSMDWQTLVTRRTKKDPADKGGWNAFHTFSVSADALNPISNSYFVANGDKAWFGWPTDPEMEKLRDAYAKETDPAKGKALAEPDSGARARDGAVRLARPVVRTGRHARQRHRLAEGAGAGDVEHREEADPLCVLRHLPGGEGAEPERRGESDRIVNRMLDFIARRLVAIIPVLAVVAVFVFLMLRLTPGDPAAVIAGDNATSDQIADIRTKLGLNEPIWTQFAIWIGNVLQGNFGESFFFKKTVAELIAQRVEPTLALAICTLIFAVSIAVPLGVLAAYRQGSLVDRFVMGFSVLGFSVPVLRHRLSA